MTKTTRRLIALTAAYAIALQAALAGVALLAAYAHAAPPVCASAGHDPKSGSVPTGTDCAACPAVCGGGGPDAVAPGGFALAGPAVAGSAVARRDTPVTAPGRGKRLLPPSRAPPAA